MREAGFQGRILFLTARDEVTDRIRGLDLGGDDYLVKPFSTYIPTPPFKNQQLNYH